MQTNLFKNYWLVGLKGTLAIVFGLFAIAIPRETILVLTLYFGIIALAAGVFITVFAIQNQKTLEHWKSFLLEGIFDLIIGLIILSNPELSAYLFIIMLGSWMLIGGLFQIWFSMKHRSEVNGVAYSLINGIFTSILGLVIAFYPINGITVLSWVIGFTTLVFGVLMLVLAWQMRKHNLASNG